MLLTMAGAGSDKSHVMSPARDGAGLQGRRNKFSILNSKNGFFEKRGEIGESAKRPLDGENKERGVGRFLKNRGVWVGDIRQQAQNVIGTDSRRADATPFKSDLLKRGSEIPHRRRSPAFTCPALSDHPAWSSRDDRLIRTYRRVSVQGPEAGSVEHHSPFRAHPFSSIKRISFAVS
jgi:hypothetical protein